MLAELKQDEVAHTKASIDLQKQISVKYREYEGCTKLLEETVADMEKHKNAFWQSALRAKELRSSCEELETSLNDLLEQEDAEREAAEDCRQQIVRLKTVRVYAYANGTILQDEGSSAVLTDVGWHEVFDKLCRDEECR